jgi:1,2-diacylglycerol 3-alpha-glucosyltransferase
LRPMQAYTIARRIITKSKGWVVTTQDPFETGIVGYCLQRKYRAGFQAQIHTDFLHPSFKKESFINRVRVFMGLFIVRRADSIRVVSSEIKKSLLLRAPELARTPIDVLPVFIDVKELRDAVPHVDLRAAYIGCNFVILMASRFTKEKNISFGINVMRRVVAAEPKALLVIVGDGPEKEVLAAQIKQLNLEKHIKLQPWVHDLRGYYKSADAFLLTSYYEGYGRAPLEAALLGVPVVMPKVGSPRGIVIETYDPELFAEALIRLHTDASFRAEVVKEQARVIEALPTFEEYAEHYRAQLIRILHA